MTDQNITQSPKSAAPVPMRHIPLAGIFNLRDTGGYPTADGGYTRWHHLWRSDNLHRLSPADQQTFIDFGIKTVIDLRYARETVQSPNMFAQAAHLHYYNIPLMATSPSLDAVPPRDLTEVYTGILDNCQPAIKAVIETVLTAADAPVLIHCTAGKDRTGTIIALLLGAVGVSDDVIVADYALTGQYIQPLLVELRAHAGRSGIDAELYERMLACTPDLMQGALHHLHEKYGSIPAYVQQLGFTSDDLARLRRMLVEA